MTPKNKYTGTGRSRNGIANAGDRSMRSDSYFTSFA